MNQWSRNRKRLILAIVLFVVFVLIGVPTFFLFYRAPTCFDMKQNGDETGIDCGGSCQLLCKAESLPLITKGDPRVLPVGNSTYAVVALVENPNSGAEIYRAGYTLKIYDAVGIIPLKEISGETYAPNASTFAIFEGPFAIEVGVTPKRVTLEWQRETLVWQKNVATLPALRVKENILSKEDSTPRLDVTLENLSLQKVSNIDLVALISDAEGNLVAASKTIIESLAPGEAAPAVFTWPKPFGVEAVGTKVIIRVFPDRSFIR